MNGFPIIAFASWEAGIALKGVSQRSAHSQRGWNILNYAKLSLFHLRVYSIRGSARGRVTGIGGVTSLGTDLFRRVLQLALACRLELVKDVQNVQG